MNNIQQTRVQLEKTYVSMGGKDLEQDAAQPLNELQSHLNVVLDALARIFAMSFNRRVEASVVSMGKLLYEVKGGGQGVAISKSEINAAADAVLEPLMDLLEGSLTTYAKICDKSVLKRLLKELWKIVIRSLEKNIVLPPAQDKSVSFSRFFRQNVCFNFRFLSLGCYQKHCERLCQHFGKAQKGGRCDGIFQGKVQWQARRKECLKCCVGKFAILTFTVV